MSITPTPMEDLYDSNQSKMDTLYVCDANGKLNISALPDCESTVMMLPLCLFVGCVMSSTVFLEFDDRNQTLTGSSAYGYTGLICPCLRTTYRYGYQDIGNVGYYATGIISHKRKLFRAVVVMKDRTRIPFTPADYIFETQTHALAMHKYLFGRNNSGYSSPEIETLYIPS